MGLKNREIADRLFISVNTVRVHINNIYGKLGVSGRVQAVARAQELALL
jgi:LuxR family maltose regulon positive regulatory protein